MKSATGYEKPALQTNTRVEEADRRAAQCHLEDKSPNMVMRNCQVKSNNLQDKIREERRQMKTYSPVKSVDTAPVMV